MGCSQSKQTDVASPAAIESAESKAEANTVTEEPKATGKQLKTEQEDHVKEAPQTLEPVASLINKSAPLATEETPNSSAVDVPESVRANFSSFNISFIDPTVSAPTSLSTESNVASTKVAAISEQEMTSIAESASKEVTHVDKDETLEKARVDELAVNEGLIELALEKEDGEKPKMDEGPEPNAKNIDEQKVETNLVEKVEETIVVNTKTADEKTALEIAGSMQEVDELKTDESVVDSVEGQSEETIAETVEEIVNNIVEVPLATTGTPEVTFTSDKSGLTKCKLAEEEKLVEDEVKEAMTFEAFAALEGINVVGEEADPVDAHSVESAAIVAVEEHVGVIEEPIEDVAFVENQAVIESVEEEIVEFVKEQIVEPIVKSIGQNLDAESVQTVEPKVEVVLDQLETVHDNFEGQEREKAKTAVTIKAAEKPAAGEQTVTHSDVVKVVTESRDEPLKIVVSTNKQTEGETEMMHSVENESTISSLSEDEAANPGLEQLYKAKLSISESVEEMKKAMEP